MHLWFIVFFSQRKRVSGKRYPYLPAFAGSPDGVRPALNNTPAVFVDHKKAACGGRGRTASSSVAVITLPWYSWDVSCCTGPCHVDVENPPPPSPALFFFFILRSVPQNFTETAMCLRNTGNAQLKNVTTDFMYNVKWSTEYVCIMYDVIAS